MELLWSKNIELGVSEPVREASDEGIVFMSQIAGMFGFGQDDRVNGWRLRVYCERG